MFLRACACLLGLLIVVPVLRADESRLHVEFVDAYGAPVAASVQASLYDGRVLVAQASGSPAVFKQLPFGRYRLRVESPGFSLVTKPVVLSEQEQFMRVGLPLGKVGDPEPSGLTVSGRVQSCSATSEAWVRVAGVFINETTEARVQADCGFRIANLAGGYYVGFLIQNGSVRDAKIIKVTAESGFLTLSANGPVLGGVAR